MIKFLLPLVFCLLIFACEEDDYVEVELSDRVEASFNGMIVDEDGQPLAGVQVTIENEFVTTGSSGTFLFSNVDVVRSNAYLKARKDGFFEGSRTVQPIPNKHNVIRIMMLAKEIAGTINAITGGEVNLTNGTRVILPAEAIVKADGSDYSGVVKIYLKHLNPMDPEMGEQMPGNLVGIDGTGEEMVLETYGMIAAELRSEAGEMLQIKAGMNAEIRIALEESLRENVPATTPLWFFDETTGLWQEEGTAQFDGEFYIGSVSHFSFWNCDGGFPFIILSVPVDINGVRSSYTTVKLKRLNLPYPVAVGYTNTEGIAWGKVPANELLELTVYDHCQGEVFMTTVGPFSSDHTLDVIDIGDAESTFLLSGAALDCGGSNMASGFVSIRYDQFEFSYLIRGGEFEIPIFICSDYDSIDIRIVDFGSILESGWLRFSIPPGSLNIGNILTCQDLSQYISIDIADTQYILIDEITAGYGFPPELEQFGENSFIQAKLFDITNNQAIWMNLIVAEGDEMVSPGTYFDQSNLLIIPNLNVSENFGVIDSVTFHTSAESGELIDGEFYGTLQNVNSTWQYDLSYSGRFHIMRTH